MATRWGVIGTSNISHDFAVAMSTLPRTEHLITAVASKDKARSQEFAEQFDIPKAYDSYSLVATDNEVDVVYVGTLNEHHYSVSRLMLEHGKNVLCEEPFCQNTEQVQQLVELARSKNLFIMEAMWMFFTPAFTILREEINKGTIGEPLQIISSFGTPMSESLIQQRNSGGSILELAVFSVYMSQFLFGPEKPQIYGACGQLTESGFDKDASVILKYSNGRISTFLSHFKVDLPNEAIVFGTKGNIKLYDPFWSATKMSVNGTDINIDVPPTKKSTRYGNSVQLIYEIQEVRNCLLKGLNESSIVPWSLSIENAILVEDIRKKLGVTICK
ncbi:trans-1,2-dihydrobenzene-1,2-diol dehydrogenase-like [Rhopalosiphum padi]|uniref:trans-1,2-dihydrobenzene-1,2-diol dehydrogenase-like n=1 Tax=Rhopalosiphum padi TaxID=40932 RepID=UPI00298E7187|nr:trans-1,2-dihydrobenzene-1,2-diol dehydrogenase-like [Rhopalosiphum padi]XP_060849246.1 trans-1,2-dihydrobenzene-1,2-diol dehydrogenase-like [Rhopalosiphum padi]